MCNQQDNIHYNTVGSNKIKYDFRVPFDTANVRDLHGAGMRGGGGGGLLYGAVIQIAVLSDFWRVAIIFYLSKNSINKYNMVLLKMVLSGKFKIKSNVYNYVFSNRSEFSDSMCLINRSVNLKI